MRSLCTLCVSYGVSCGRLSAALCLLWDDGMRVYIKHICIYKYVIVHTYICICIYTYMVVANRIYLVRMVLRAFMLKGP